MDINILTQEESSTPKLYEPFASEAIHSLPDGHVEWNETNAQIDQLLGGLLFPHQPALFVLLNSDVKIYKRLPKLAQPSAYNIMEAWCCQNGSPVNWEFRVHISNFIGEVNQAFHGRQAQVPSLRR